MDKEELYKALVALCQHVGLTTEQTYELLHAAVDSIRLDACEYCGIECAGQIVNSIYDENPT